jgi:hypothetical protein
MCNPRKAAKKLLATSERILAKENRSFIAVISLMQMNAVRQGIPWPKVARPRTRGRFTRIVRVAMAIAMCSQAAVLWKLNGLGILSFKGPQAAGLLPELLVCFFGAAASFAVSVLVRERPLIANLVAGAGCVLACLYYLFMEPVAFFAAQLSSDLFVLPLVLLLPTSSILTLRDIVVGLKAAGKKERPDSALQKPRESTYLVTAIYAIQGALLLLLLFLESLPQPLPFRPNFGNASIPWINNFFYLLFFAGLLSISAAVLRSSQRTASAIIALQGTLAGFWFGLMVFIAYADPVFLHRIGVWASITLALFFLPLFFTLAFTLRDLLAAEHATAILLRLAAGCCAIALLREFRWPEVGHSVEDSLLLIGVLLGYLLVAFHPPSYFRYAVALAAVPATLAILFNGFVLVMPDFSGMSLYTRERPDVLLVFFTNVALILATGATAFAFARASRSQT